MPSTLMLNLREVHMLCRRSMHIYQLGIYLRGCEHMIYDSDETVIANEKILRKLIMKDRGIVEP